MAPDPRAEPVSPAFLSRLVGRIGEQIAQSTQGGKDVVLVVRSNVRRFLGELVRASLPRSLDAGAWQDLRMEIPPLAPGHYHLKLDLVSEGIDWFESCGSEVTLRELRIE